MKKLILWNKKMPTDKESFLKAISDYLANEQLIANSQKLLIDLKKRESVGNTIVYPGLAIPHTQSSSVQETIMLIASLKEKVSWSEGETVSKVIFMLLPVHPQKSDLLELKKLFVQAADDEFMVKVLTGSRKDIQQLLDIKGE